MIRSLTFKAIMPVVGKSEGVRVIRELIDQILAWCREFKVTPPTPDPFYKQRAVVKIP